MPHRSRVRFYESLRARVILIILVTLVVTVGGTYWYIIQRQSDQFVETIKEQARIMTHAMVKTIQHDMKGGSCAKDIQGIFERIGLLPDVESLRIFDENGRVTKSADPEEVGLTIEDIGLEIFKANVPSTPYLGGHGQNAFCMVERIGMEESCRECHDAIQSPVLGIFELCLSLEKTDRRIAANRNFMVASAVLTILLVGGVLSFFLTRQVNYPLERLSRAMRRAEDGDLKVRADVGRRDELGIAARSFNAMIARLEEAREQVDRLHTDQLIRADRLATIGELAAGVAHEIKNPLAGISGAVQVLATDFEPQDPRRVITDQIVRQTERMDKTIRDLLNFAQPLEADLSEVDVNRVLDDALFICLPNPATSRVTVAREYAAGLPPVVIDAKHLQQAFINIILNAIQAMPKGGTLTLRTAAAGPADAPTGVVVAVGDTGPGIPRASADKVFSPFYTTKTEGTGLGLSITRRILEIHQGTISYASEEGKGTVFAIELPLSGTGEGRPA